MGGKIRRWNKREKEHVEEDRFLQCVSSLKIEVGKIKLSKQHHTVTLERTVHFL